MRIILRFIFRLIRDIDGILTAVTTGIIKKILKPDTKKSWELTGSCKKRGLCCKNIAIQMPPTADTSPFMLNMIKTWYCFVYNFKFKGQQQNVLYFSCNYLKDNMCSIYWRRPYICRRYPNTRYFKTPSIIPGCGYNIKSNEHKN